MTAPVLTIKDMQFAWPGRTGFGLRVPSFEMRTSESVLLLGHSGAGKSTLLSVICGTAPPQSGQIKVAGTDLNALPARARDRFRAETVGVIFQQFNLLPFATVRDNILLPLRFAPNRAANVSAPDQAVQALCTGLGLPARVLDQRADSLSVGQQQRVAVARALIGAPPLIVADEPTSALDAHSQMQFLDLMFAQAQQQKTALLMVSHDERLAARFDRVVELTDIARTYDPEAAPC